MHDFNKLKTFSSMMTCTMTKQLKKNEHWLLCFLTLFVPSFFPYVCRVFCGSISFSLFDGWIKSLCFFFHCRFFFLRRVDLDSCCSSSRCGCDFFHARTVWLMNKVTSLLLNIFRFGQAVIWLSFFTQFSICILGIASCFFQSSISSLVHVTSSQNWASYHLESYNFSPPFDVGVVW